MDFSKTKLSLRRHPLDYSKVRTVAGAVLRGWPIRSTPRLGDYLNIGAGPYAKEGYFNLDYNYAPGIDLFWDLKNPLPMKTGSIGGIFTEHCLEHLEFEVNQRLLRELHRILMPGRTIRIVVPDGEMYVRSYAEGRDMPFGSVERSRDPQWTPMQSINMLFYGHGHRFIYDFATMKCCLEEAGFVDVRKEQFGSGRDRKLLIDQEVRRCESLYVEASKSA